LRAPMWLPSLFCFTLLPRPPRAPRFPYTTLFRSHRGGRVGGAQAAPVRDLREPPDQLDAGELDERAQRLRRAFLAGGAHVVVERSEEHTSELQSRGHLVCRLLLEKKKINHRE